MDSKENHDKNDDGDINIKDRDEDQDGEEDYNEEFG